MRGIGGEIVQVQGGHIVRSTGRKDRHSKVYTAKGTRDRRVRLSAHTAIQFYDVQDRLGYDRPSKAVDWLIKNAKSAIDKLAELPAWHPKTGAEAPITACGNNNDDDNNRAVSGMEMGRTADESDELKELEPSGFVPSQHLDPVSDSLMNIISRKDLGLSLQSFNVPKQQPEQTAPFFSHSSGFRFEAGDNDNYHRPATKNWSTDNRNDDFSFNQMPTSSHPTVNLGGFNFSQRGTLQSSFPTMLHQFNGRFVSEGFPGMCIPGQMQDNEEESNTTTSQKQPPTSTYGCLSSSGHSLKGI